ncbi:conserved hypothetical protein [Alteromonas infernus]|jgi:hypothetical protein
MIIDAWHETNHSDLQIASLLLVSPLIKAFKKIGKSATCVIAPESTNPSV